METEQSTVQTLGGMTLTSKNVFFIPDEELKNFYLKFAYLSNPNACSVNRTEFQLLNILFKDLKKRREALGKFNEHTWDKGMMEIQTSHMYYLTRESLPPKERVRINNCVSEHLTFLTQMAGNSRTMRQMYEVYARHYHNVERLLKQYDGELPKGEEPVVE